MFYPRTAGWARIAVSAAAFALVATGCSGHDGAMNAGGTQGAIPQGRNPGHTSMSSASIMKHLTSQVVIGSVIDPVNGAQNPYGLTIAPSTNGKLTAGDLVVCNFNFEIQPTGKRKVDRRDPSGTRLDSDSPDSKRKQPRLRRARARPFRRHLGCGHDRQ